MYLFSRHLSELSGFFIFSILLNAQHTISALHPRGPPFRRRLRRLSGPGCCLAGDSSPSRFRYRTGRCTRGYSRSRTCGIAGVRRSRVRSLLHAGCRGIAGRQLLRHSSSSRFRKSNYSTTRQRTHCPLMQTVTH